MPYLSPLCSTLTLKIKMCSSDTARYCRKEEFPTQRYFGFNSYSDVNPQQFIFSKWRKKVAPELLVYFRRLLLVDPKEDSSLTTSDNTTPILLSHKNDNAISLYS